MRRWSAGIVLAALGPGCGDNGAVIDAGPSRELVSEFPVFPKRDVDLLFVMKDSFSGTPEVRRGVSDAFRDFVVTLDSGLGILPNLHIGVVSTDLGTMGADDVTPGPSFGGCSGDGLEAKLQTGDTPLVTGSFISDAKNDDGTRSTNYTGSLNDAFSAIVSGGRFLCGIEQPLEAMKRALDSNPANTGFLRRGAALGVMVVTDEDDCSLRHSSLLTPDTTTLGPLSRFRCFKYGVRCDGGGTTPDELAEGGLKTGCHSNESSAYLMPVAPYASFLTSLKSDPNQVFFGAIVAPTNPVEVYVNSDGPSLLSPYTYAGGGTQPPIRIAEVAGLMPKSSLSNVCDSSYTGALSTMGDAIRDMFDHGCVERTLATPVDCLVEDVVGETRSPMPACTDPIGITPCWHLVADAGACPRLSHERVSIERTVPPVRETIISVRCRLE